MGVRIRSAKRDAGDGSGIFVGINQAGVGFAVDGVAIPIDGHFLASEHAPMVPLKIGVARNGEYILKKASSVDAGRCSMTRRGWIEELNGDGSGVALRHDLIAGKVFPRRGLLEILKRLGFRRGQLRRLRLKAESGEKGQGSCKTAHILIV